MNEKNEYISQEASGSCILLETKWYPGDAETFQMQSVLKLASSRALRSFHICVLFSFGPHQLFPFPNSHFSCPNSKNASHHRENQFFPPSQLSNRRPIPSNWSVYDRRCRNVPNHPSSGIHDWHRPFHISRLNNIQHKPLSIYIPFNYWSFAQAQYAGSVLGVHQSALIQFHVSLCAFFVDDHTK